MQDNTGCGSTRDERQWIWTNSGKQLYFVDTQPNEFCIEDIASSLSKLCRYTGQIDYFYSVADHSCNLVDYLEERHPDIVPDAKLWALLHDAAESGLNDVARPPKQLLKDYKKLESTLQIALMDKFNINISEDIYKLIKFYDANIIADEADLLFTTAPPQWTENFIRLNATIRYSEYWRIGYNRFLHYYHRIERERGNEINT